MRLVFMISSFAAVVRIRSRCAVVCARKEEASHLLSFSPHLMQLDQHPTKCCEESHIQVKTLSEGHPED